ATGRIAAAGRIVGHSECSPSERKSFGKRSEHPHRTADPPSISSPCVAIEVRNRVGTAHDTDLRNAWNTKKRVAAFAGSDSNCAVEAERIYRLQAESASRAAILARTTSSSFTAR